jgi:dipeptidyl-peptidase-3
LRRTNLPFLAVLLLALLGACRSESANAAVALEARPADPDRQYLLERVGDVAVVQLYADGFEGLAPKEKLLVWHLYQAALAGRDIHWQQKSVHGLALRDLVEELLTHPDGIEPETLEHVRHYAQLLWVNNGPYDHLTARKHVMQGSRSDLRRAVEQAAKNGARFGDGADPLEHLAGLERMLFDEDHLPMVTAKNPERGGDVIRASAVTFYDPGVSVRNLAGFPERYELNSTIARLPSGQYEERVWRAGWPAEGIAPGLYAQEIESIIAHLEAAMEHAPKRTRRALEALVRFYRTGEREDRVAYDVAWVADKDSKIDSVNGFIEVYHDPRGKKGSWEGLVFYEDPHKAAQIQRLAENAQWFEDHMPYDAEFKKPNVKGISARSIDVVIETGDAGPVSAIGINLPNDAAVREQHGSKSVSLANVEEANAMAFGLRSLAEFCWDEAEIARAEQWQRHTSNLLTNMHEVIGHASGRQAPDRQGEHATWIKEYSSALEEARADLVALYFMMDPKLAQLGLLEDPEAGALAAYEAYTRNGGLQQLRRVRTGDQLEQDHMKNRQMVVRWILENSNAIEERLRDGKHYLVVTDARAWRAAAGELLRSVQRIKSTGDYAGAKALFDEHGLKFDPALRDEIVARYEPLGVPAYTGFVMPRLTPVTNAKGKIVDVAISYPLSLEQQMLEWSGRRVAP